MPVDGPWAVVQAEKAIPLIEPAGQQAASVVKQWHEDLGAAAAAAQPTPQHHLKKINQQVDVQHPIDKSQQSPNGDKTPNHPDLANQFEAEALLRERLLQRARQRKSQRANTRQDDETSNEEGGAASRPSSSRHSRDDDGPVSAV